MRFFAALHVALYHLFFHHDRTGPLWSFVGAGYQGVSFFFVLSGYILTYTHAQEYESGKDRTSRFLFARLARVYPVYLLSMLLAAYLGWQMFRNPLHAFVFLIDLCMLQAWSVRTVLFFNIPAWSLCCEAFFYVCFPLLILRLRPQSRLGAIGSLGVWWLLAISAPIVSLWHTFGAPGHLWIPEQPGAFAFALRRVPLFALPEFLAGITAGWLQVRFHPRAHTTLVLSLLGITGCAAALFFADHLPDTLLHNGFLIPAYVCVLLGFSGENAVAHALSAAPLVLLGEASYAFYLFHYQLNDGWNRTFGAHETAQAAALKLPCFLLVAIAVHLLVERPCRRWLLQWWHTRDRHFRTANSL